MPEGDTIRRLAAEVRARVEGRTATWSTFRHPRLATLDLTGRTLVDVSSHGKHLFLHWDDGWSLHIHLLMDGRVRFGGAPEVEEWRRRFEIVFDGGLRMTGIDIPLLHRIRTDDTGRLVDHLGPDVCGRLAPTDLEVIVARLGGAGSEPLSGALLDQRNVAGFGNIYAVEVPYICGLSPFRPVAEVDGLAGVVAVGAALIRTNAELGPQNTTGRRLHRTEHWILDDRTRNCSRCGASLRRLSGDETPWRRKTAWCPSCQPDDAGVPDLARARKLLALHPARRLLRFDPAPRPGPEDGAAAGGEDEAAVEGGAGAGPIDVSYIGPPDPVPVRRSGRAEGHRR